MAERDPHTLKRRVVELAREAGFDAVAVTRAVLPAEVGAGLEGYVAAGRHGEMAWMADTLDRRRTPAAMWPDAVTAIVLGMNYAPDGDPLPALAAGDRAYVSVYARHRDYHDLVKKRLKQVARQLAEETGAEVKVFVDTAPLLEKPLAAQAGLGWQGKHTNLVSRRFGSWLFLGEILTTLDLPPDAPEGDRCGSCRRCLDVCPTGAFTGVREIDPRRCISYLTIEHKGPIPRALRAALGNRVYGCDDCLAVCPWNRFAQRCDHEALRPRPDLDAGPPLADLAGLDDAAFRALFSGSPIKRVGRDRFVRNVLNALGNSGRGDLAPVAEGLLEDAAPVVRGAAVWAFARLAPPPAVAAARARLLPAEVDADVRAEWEAVAC
ncbi:tRNA epoxyqueuosine(34) reductase QueG [Novispirillum sp. DQ9]|uniref:tRNA epoxyqueuosine(34) reductase QueG n=1 Tax=Novispirillum sp. DQ9 TaxID=3398612 RepID=UPI003C79ABF0